MFNIIKTRYIWLTLSGILTALSIVAMIIWGFKVGIDFTGGSLLKLKFSGTLPTSQEVNEALKDLNIGEITVQTAGTEGMIIRSKYLDQSAHKELLTKLENKFGGVSEESFETIGPTIGQELQHKAFWAIGLAIFGIIIYIAWAFKKVSSGPVSSWAYGLAAIIALTHDILVTLGIFAFLGHFFNIEFNILLVSALLTILGYSVNDTIVVFDRIRANLLYNKARDFKEVINESINQTLIRSLNTGMCALFVLFTLFLFGGESIHWFVLALMIGFICGTYSSFFIASPILLIWQKVFKR